MITFMLVVRKMPQPVLRFIARYFQIFIYKTVFLFSCIKLAIFMHKTVKKIHPVAILNLFQLKSSLVSTRMIVSISPQRIDYLCANSV